MKPLRPRKEGELWVRLKWCGQASRECEDLAATEKLSVLRTSSLLKVLPSRTDTQH